MLRVLGRLALWVSTALLFAIPALFATPVAALPQPYSFVSGSVHVTAQVVGQTSLLVDTVDTLNGTFFDFDSATASVSNFQISLTPTGPIAMNGRYGGYDMFTINSALLVPGTGYTSAGIPIGGPQYSVQMGPLNVNAVYSATDSTNTNPPANNVPISYVNPLLTATVDTNLVTFQLLGVTLGVIPGALVGETSDLIVKGDITFLGVSAIVPEPSTGFLLGLGLIAVGLRSRRSGSSPGSGHL